MEKYYENAVDMFWYFVIEGNKLTRYYGMSGVLAYKKEEKLSFFSKNSLIKEYEKQIKKQGFSLKAGKPDINYSKTWAWEQVILQDIVRYLESPDGKNFWLVTTRNDETHNMFAIGEGTVGGIGLKAGKTFGKNNADVLKEIERLVMEQKNKGYVEKDYPEDLYFTLIRGSVKARLGSVEMEKKKAEEKTKAEDEAAKKDHTFLIISYKDEKDEVFHKAIGAYSVYKEMIKKSMGVSIHNSYIVVPMSIEDTIGVFKEAFPEVHSYEEITENDFFRMTGVDATDIFY